MPIVPIAAHTFGFDRVYLSSRTLAPPGAGTWSIAQIIFDQYTNPNFLGLSTFSSGALTPAEINNRGIVGITSPLSPPFIGGLATVFCGNGIPDTPRLITCATLDYRDFNTALDFWDISNGAWWYGAKNAYYYFGKGGHSQRYFMLKSVDAGVTWTEMDSANAPPFFFGDDGATVARTGDKVDVFSENGANDAWCLNTFDFATDTWTGSYGAITIPSVAVNTFSHQFGDFIFRFPNGDIGVLYDDVSGFHPHVKYRLYDGVTPWQAQVDVTNPADTVDSILANMVADPGGQLLHVFTYHVNGGRGNPRYHTVTHAGVVTLDKFIFPTFGGAVTDGVGHCLIINGMIFAPYDHKNVNTNSVWVAPLATGIFLEELLPHPPTEANQVGTSVLNNPGINYAVGDTGTISGGAAPGGTAGYVITAIGGAGDVVGYSVGPLGNGYAPATNVGMVPGGAQPGIGTGFTIDLQTVQDATISCAYMLLGQPIGPPPSSGRWRVREM